jgi:hypothetical protein
VQLICADGETEVDQGQHNRIRAEQRDAPRAQTIDQKLMPQLVSDTTPDNVAAIDMSSNSTMSPHHPALVGDHPARHVVDGH